MSTSGAKDHIDSIHQLLPSLGNHDAIGNEVRLIRDILRGQGYRSEIFADHGDARPIREFLRARYDKTAALFHFSIASTIPYLLAPLPVRKLVRYHNITPPEFFSGIGEQAAQQACAIGRKQIPMVGVISDFISTPSKFNADEIQTYSAQPVEIIPVLRDYEVLKQGADYDYSHALNLSKKKSMIFVGRISPHKAQHNLIKFLWLSKQFVSKDVRLILVGGFFSEDFARRIRNLAQDLELKVGSDILSDCDADILIPRVISDSQMAALYRHATVFVSMSEHEGFGVPLVEAMNFDLPIIAFATSAVGETIGKAGLLLHESDWPGILSAFKALLENPNLRSELIAAGQIRSAELGLSVIGDKFQRWVTRSLRSK